jgi:ATP:ADP antiporter, AAA family
MQSPRVWLSRLWDVRAGEGLAVVLAFFVLLFVISGHTILETTRDALLLTKLPARELGFVYVAVAVCALPVATIAGRASRRLGPRSVLVATLAIAAALAMIFFVLPANRISVVALYVVSALIATTAVPQFWTLLDGGLTVAQARRLFGPIASAGVFGGVLGSATAAAALPWIHVKGLLLVSGLIFTVAAGVVAFFPIEERPGRGAPTQPSTGISMAEVRQEPFVLRLALVVAVSTAAVLAVDYFFKWTVARNVPPAQIGSFVARYYAGLNVVSLFVQLLVGAALVRKAGLAAAIVVTPIFLIFGALGALVLGGAMLSVLVMKGIDGSLRYSIHRITTELLYLPLGPGLRERAKPIIDGAVVRAAQAITAGFLLLLGGTTLLSPRLFAAIVVVLGVAWAAIAFAIRGPYLNLLRDAVSNGPTDRRYTVDPLDLTSAEMLVEFLASGDPMEVIAAMNTLVRRGHARLVPALILYHHDEGVLRKALEILSESPRADWVTLGRSLLDHPSETLRMSAARALASRGLLDVEHIADDASSRVKGYATLAFVLGDRSSADVATDPRIAAILTQTGPAGDDARVGLLAATADARSAEPLTELLLELTRREPKKVGTEWIELAARAAVRVGDVRLVPFLIAHLTTRQGREAVRAALAALGEPAFDAVWRTLSDTTQDRRLRAQLPSTLAAFGNKNAAERLLESVETERDGLVRYKSIRALASVVVFANVRVNRQRVEKLAYANLVEYFQILGRRVALGAGESDSRVDRRVAALTGRLLPGLLDDKLNHSLERAFRLLKIAHPGEDIHRVYIACLSKDRHARASAGELLDALFTRHSQQRLRVLLRLVADDVTPAEQVARAAGYLGFAPPPTHDAAVLELIDDHDVGVAALAALYATGLGRPSLLSAVEAVHARRGEIERTAVRLFKRPDPIHGSDQVAHG